MISEAETRLQALGLNIDDVIHSLSLSEEPYTIFVSGSIIEGYGNAESDLDVFVVYPNEVPSLRTDIDMETNSISLEYISEQRLDIEHWSKDQVIAVSERIRQCSPDDWENCFHFSYNDIEFAHSLRIGLPIQQTDHFVQLQQAFDFEQVSHIITMKRVGLYHSVQEDAAGAIASKQEGTALLMARYALQLAIDAWLASQGETNAKDKWRFFKLQKADPKILTRYWELETQGVDASSVFEYAKECLRFGNQLVTQAQKIRL